MVLTPGGRIPIEVDTTKFSSSSTIGDARCAGAVVASLDPSELDGMVVRSTNKIVALQDSIDSFVTLLYADKQTIRVSVHLSPQSPTVRSSFVALSQLCSASLLFDIRRRFLSAWGVLRHLGTHDEEFGCFAEAVTRSLGIEVPLRVAHDDDAWAQMSKHPIHQQLLNDSALRGLRFPDTLSRRWPEFAVHAEMSRTLHALHLFAEELKVDGSRRHELTMLAPLLLRLGHCVGPDWVEYWLRNCPDVIDDWQLSSSCEYLPIRVTYTF